MAVVGDGEARRRWRRRTRVGRQAAISGRQWGQQCTSWQTAIVPCVTKPDGNQGRRRRGDDYQKRKGRGLRGGGGEEEGNPTRKGEGPKEWSDGTLRRCVWSGQLRWNGAWETLHYGRRPHWTTVAMTSLRSGEESQKHRLRPSAPSAQSVAGRVCVWA